MDRTGNVGCQLFVVIACLLVNKYIKPKLTVIFWLSFVVVMFCQNPVGWAVSVSLLSSSGWILLASGWISFQLVVVSCFIVIVPSVSASHQMDPMDLDLDLVARLWIWISSSAICWQQSSLAASIVTFMDLDLGSRCRLYFVRSASIWILSWNCSNGTAAMKFGKTQNIWHFVTVSPHCSCRSAAIVVRCRRSEQSQPKKEKQRRLPLSPLDRSYQRRLPLSPLDCSHCRRRRQIHSLRIHFANSAAIVILFVSQRKSDSMMRNTVIQLVCTV